MVGVSDDDVIEATQFPVASRVISVQWHPEFLPRSGATKLLFRALADEAAGVPQPAPLEDFLDGSALPA